MSVETSVEHTTSYQSDPRFQATLNHFQLGEWGPGLTELEKLIQDYPLEHELRRMRQEMLLRARIDKDEKEDISRNRIRRLKTIGIRVAVLVLVAAVVFFGIQFSSASIRAAIDESTNRWNAEALKIQRAATFRNAQELLRAGRAEEALTIFEDLKTEVPDYPGLEENMQLAREKALIDLKYEEAMRDYNLGNLEAAKAKFEEIHALDPLYLDVQQRISSIEGQFELNAELTQADAAFQEGRWQDAVEAYEQLRTDEPNFETQHVEERLIQSLMKAGENCINQDDSLEAMRVCQDFYKRILAEKPQDAEVTAILDAARGTAEDRLVRNYLVAAQLALTDNSDSLDALEIAEDFLSKARAIRPDSPEIELQHEMAQRYLKAQAEFNRGEWDPVIENLEFIYANQMDYANGTARQILYDAYMARGDSLLAKAEYNSALSDFQRAATLAQDDPGSALRIYEAQIKIAEAKGALGENEEAVNIYQNAIEFGGIRNQNLEQYPEFAAALAEADAYALSGNYRMAYRAYREAMRRVNQTYETVTHTVKSGEYLSMIAARYRSTVQAIAEANNIANPNRIFTGQELLIPVIK
jgi:tetratricopeptide (TPR) repeat protein